MTEQPAGPTYALYASFAADPARALPDEQRPHAAAEAQAALESTGATLRGAYTVTGYRADADILLWLVGHTADDVQDGLIAFRRTALGRSLRPAWSGIGVHRDAEFAKSHTPAFMRGEAPGRYVSVYPYVRSLEWYLLPEDERSEMLREHGLMGRRRAATPARSSRSTPDGAARWPRSSPSCPSRRSPRRGGRASSPRVPVAPDTTGSSSRGCRPRR